MSEDQKRELMNEIREDLKEEISSGGSVIDFIQNKFISKKLLALAVATYYFQIAYLSEENWFYVLMLWMGMQGWIDKEKEKTK